MLYPTGSTLVKLGHFISLFNSHSWVLIIYLSFWTFLYSNFLISSLFLCPLTSFRFQSRGGINTLLLIATTIYFLGAFFWPSHLLSLLGVRILLGSWHHHLPSVQYYRYQAVHSGLAIYFCISFFGIRYLYLSLPTWLLFSLT